MPQLTQDTILKKDPKALKAWFLEDENEELIENREVLNHLSHDDKLKLLTELLIKCTPQELKDLRHKKSALDSPNTNSQTGFADYMASGIEVAATIYGLMDPKNTAPHEAFLPEQCNYDAFNLFAALTIELVKDKEAQIAQRLVESVYSDNKAEINSKMPQQLCKTIRNVFVGTTLPSKVQAAMLTYNLLAQFTGCKPDSMFNDSEFNADLFHEFDEMVQYQLSGFERQIVNKLVNADSDKYSGIAKKLSQLSSKCKNPSHPLKMISDLFQQKIGQLESESKVNENRGSSPLINQSTFRPELPRTASKKSTSCCIIV